MKLSCKLYSFGFLGMAAITLMGCSARQPMKLVESPETRVWMVEAETTEMKLGDRYAVVTLDCRMKKRYGRTRSKKYCTERDVVGLTVKRVDSDKSALVELDREINMGVKLEIEKREQQVESR